MKLVAEKFVELLYNILEGIQKLSRVSRADKLLLAAFLVAMFRQMGVNGHFIGFDPATAWPWFPPLESLTGIAMAGLEGIALAYVSKRWRKIKPESYTDWIYWSILAIGQLTVATFIVVYVVLYGYAAQRGMFVWEAVPISWNIVFNITVAGANVLIAILIGIVDDTEQQTVPVLSQNEEAWLELISYLKENSLRRITPKTLADLSDTNELIASKVIQEAISMGIVVGE